MGRPAAQTLAPWIAGVLTAVPIVVVRYPPMGDLAMHEAQVAILRHLSDPTFVPPGLYRFIGPQANQLFHLTALALSYVVPTALACKLVVAAAVLATPVLGARLLARRGLSTWPALALCPVVLGWMFTWGLVGSMLGFAVLLYALPALERLARRPSPRAAAAAALVTLLAFFAHASSALALAICASYFAIVRTRRWRAGPSLLRGTPALVVLALGLAQGRVAAALRGAHMQSLGDEYGAEPLDRLRIFAGAIFGGQDVGRLAALGIVTCAALVASAWCASRGREVPLRLALWRHRYAVLAATFFFLYLGFPMTYGGNTLLAHRFLAPMCACLVVACACAARRASRLSAALAVAAPAVLVVFAAPSFVSSDARFRALDEVIAFIPNNTAVAQLDLTLRPPGLVAPVVGAAGRVQAERGGRMLFAFTDNPPNPVYLRPGASWDEPVARLSRAPFAFIPAHDLRRFAFVLVHDPQRDAQELIGAAFEPEGEVVARRGDWMLVRSRLAVLPIDGPDVPVPSAPPETLGARVARRLMPP